MVYAQDVENSTSTDTDIGVGFFIIEYPPLDCPISTKNINTIMQEDHL